jgi:hypothetical protein
MQASLAFSFSRCRPTEFGAAAMRRPTVSRSADG